jgi:hypothetical protein
MKRLPIIRARGVPLSGSVNVPYFYAYVGVMHLPVEMQAKLRRYYEIIELQP